MYVLKIVVCPFVFFPLAIVLSVLHRFAGSDYPFSIFIILLAQCKGYICVSKSVDLFLVLQGYR